MKMFLSLSVGCTVQVVHIAVYIIPRRYILQNANTADMARIVPQFVEPVPIMLPAIL